MLIPDTFSNLAPVKFTIRSNWSVTRLTRYDSPENARLPTTKVASIGHRNSYFHIEFVALVRLALGDAL